jgi:hypothetical protein
MEKIDKINLLFITFKWINIILLPTKSKYNHELKANREIIQ